MASAGAVMADAVSFDNPDGVHPPPGPYSHAVRVPPGSELVFLAGQIGMRPDGSVPESIGAQAEQAFANVTALLESLGLAVADVIKLSVFVVDGQDLGAVTEARLRAMAGHTPTSTTVRIAGLVRPEWLVEVEAVAARPPGARA